MVAHSDEQICRNQVAVRPIVINHGLCYWSDDQFLSDIEYVMDAINGNSGNGFITYAMSRFFDFGTRVPGIANMWSFFSNDRGLADEVIERVNSEYTHAFFVFQDQIQLGTRDINWDGLTQFLRKIKIPVVVFSLGANGIDQSSQEVAANLSKSQIRFFRELDEHALSLGIRGEYTAEVLRKIGASNFAVVGCPTYFAQGKDRRLIKRPYDPEGMVLAGGLFSSNEAKRLHFVFQSEELFIRSNYAGPGASPAAIELLRSYYPGYASCVLSAALDGRTSFFASPAVWNAFVRKHNFLMSVGTRVHGAIMAINAGIPALVTAGDARAKEMTDLFGIPLAPGMSGLDVEVEATYETLDVESMNQRYDDLFVTFIKWLESLDIYSGLYPPIEERYLPEPSVKKLPRIDANIKLVNAICQRL